MIFPVPLEPLPTVWQMPDPGSAGGGDLVATGADLEPGTLLAAYRSGLFPMPVDGRLAWWSPEPRAVLPPGGLVVSRSLRRSCARYEVRVDTGFEEVVAACADSPRPGGWISAGIRAAYVRLHELGWAHSVEAWTPGGELAGGLYGVALGGLFAGESMFHRHTDASKVALVALVALLSDGQPRLLDVQWQTDHLATLGAVEISRSEYLSRLAVAVTLPLPAVFACS
jgi:leucyl/phenylalanyl-tRNA---protein transferase